MLEFLKSIFCRKEICKLIECEKKYEKDSKYYQDRISALTTALEHVIPFPDISQELTTMKVVVPYEIIKGYDIICADIEYYALPFDNWKRILDSVQKNISANWTKEVFDCDDWALVMSSLVAYSTYKSGIDKQLAMCISWSPTHAYNCFVDTDKKVWVYEPQNSNIIGTLGSTTSAYDTIKIWFMG